MEYQAGQGLEKNNQGDRKPIQAKGNPGRQEVEYQPF